MTKTTKTVRTTTTIKNTDGSVTTTVVETITEGATPDKDPEWIKDAMERFERMHRAGVQSWNSKP
jgi:hypothetical protein